MHHRRSTIPALLLALPVGAALTSCGFDYPTDQVNTIAAGTNDREGTVDVLGARIVATADGTGRLIGALANNDDQTASLTAVSGADGSVTADLEPVEVPPGESVNLAEDVEIPVSGEFAAGEVVVLVYEFDTGEVVDLDVPVFKQCYQHADVEVPTPESTPGDDATGDATGEATDETSDETSDVPAEESHGEESGGSAYICDHETPGTEEGDH